MERSSHVADGRTRLLDKTESAGRLLVPVQSHDYAFDVTAFGEELVDLLFGREEGQVADVQRARGGNIT